MLHIKFWSLKLWQYCHTHLVTVLNIICNNYSTYSGLHTSLQIFHMPCSFKRGWRHWGIINITVLDTLPKPFFVLFFSLFLLYVLSLVIFSYISSLFLKR